jgi:hypothetical protein
VLGVDSGEADGRRRSPPEYSNSAAEVGEPVAAWAAKPLGSNYESEWAMDSASGWAGTRRDSVRVPGATRAFMADPDQITVDTRHHSTRE